jgi:hypothetical protein
VAGVVDLVIEVTGGFGVAKREGGLGVGRRVGLSGSGDLHSDLGDSGAIRKYCSLCSSSDALKGGVSPS